MDPTSFTPHSLCLTVGDDVVLCMMTIDRRITVNGPSWETSFHDAGIHFLDCLKKVRAATQAMPYTNVSHDASPADILAAALHTLSTKCSP